jgi:hypothetical protein
MFCVGLWKKWSIRRRVCIGFFRPTNQYLAVCWFNSRFPLLRFRSALHCGYSGITDKYSGLE